MFLHIVVLQIGLAAAACAGKDSADSLRTALSALRFREAEEIAARCVQGADAGGPEGLPRRLAAFIQASDTYLRSNDTHLPEARADAESVAVIQQRLVGLPDSTIASAHAVLGNTYRRLGRYSEADSLLRLALKLRIREFGAGSPPVATALLDLGTELSVTGKLSEARALCDSAHVIRSRIFGPEALETADCEAIQGNILRELGEFARAEALYLHVFRVRKRLGTNHPDVGRVLRSRGIMLEAQGLYIEARNDYERALQISKRWHGDRHPETAALLGDLANVYIGMAQFESARDTLRRAIDIQERLLGRHPALAASYETLSEALLGLGDLDEARQCSEQALSIDVELLGASSPAVATDLVNLASVFAALGNFEEARTLYERARKIQTREAHSDSRELAGTIVELAKVQVLSGNYLDALKLYEIAAASQRRMLGEEHPSLGTTLTAQAIAEHLARRDGRAEKTFRMAIKVLGNTPMGMEHPDYASALREMAVFEADRGRFDESRDMLMEARQVLEGTVGVRHPRTGLVLQILARISLAQGDAATADSLSAAAAECFEGARLKINEGIERATFQDSPYPVQALARLQLGDTRGAWTATERAFGRVLSEVLFQSRARVRPVSRSERILEDSLRVAIAGSELVIRDAWQESLDALEVTPQTRIQKYQSEEAAALERLQTLEGRISARRPVAEGKALPLEDVQRILGEGQALVGWLNWRCSFGGSQTWAYVLKRQGPPSWIRLDHDERGRAAMDSSALRYARSLQSSSRPASLVRLEAREVWDCWFRPLEPLLAGVRTLVTVPCASLARIPLDALQDSSGDYLGSRYEFTSAPSGSVFAYLRSMDSSSGPAMDRALLVGDPPFSPQQLADMQRRPERGAPAESGGLVRRGAAVAQEGSGNRVVSTEFARLPATRTEVSEIAALTTRALVLLGPDATVGAIRGMASSTELGEFGTIHLATHAVINPGAPGQSRLIFAFQSSPDSVARGVTHPDGKAQAISLSEILRTWKLRAQLVTLSACETATGTELKSEGVVGFAHALLQTGAQSVLASLWKVDDEATALIMGRFYRNWWGKKGSAPGDAGGRMGRAAALTEAKLWLRNHKDSRGRNKFDKPYYWAGFVLVGNPD